MEKEVVVKIADSVLTPFGLGTEINYNSVKAGKSCLQRYEGKWRLPAPFVASFIDDSILNKLCYDLNIEYGYSRLEQMAIAVVHNALKNLEIEISGNNVAFIFASAKGNIHLLENGDVVNEKLQLPTTAGKIARWFGNDRPPFVVSNACISGVHAQIEAWRLLKYGSADIVVVVASDMLSPFIVSGFQSFKAVSDELCRPFDEERLGLNLGEAAACAVYKRMNIEEALHGSWSIATGAVNNDAYHISHPSKTAEGSFLALMTALKGCSKEEIAMINVHGTATMFNDEMEAVALERADLSTVPINSLKGYFGHTMGAAGLLETIVTMAAMDDNIILGTKGFKTIGVSRNVNIASENRTTTGTKFIKIMSGFGGCNAAIRYERIDNGKD